MSSEDNVNKTKQDTKKYEEKENVTASYHTCYHTCYRFITRIYTIFSHVTAKATWRHLFLLLFFKLMRKTYNFSSRPHHGIFIVVVFIVRVVYTPLVANIATLVEITTSLANKFFGSRQLYCFTFKKK